MSNPNLGSNLLTGISGTEFLATGVLPVAALTAGTGMINSDVGSTAIDGVGTDFLTELSVGQVIMFAGTARRIASIPTASNLILDKPAFATTVGQAFSYQPPYHLVYKRVKIKNTHAANAALVDGQTLPAGEEIELTNPYGLYPVAYTTGTATLFIEIQY